MTTRRNRGRDYPGARWWKFDFHTHTPASKDYGKGFDQENLRNLTPCDWLLGFMRAGLDCVAVTDHNSGAWIEELKEALRKLEQEPHGGFRPLHLFPGVEITANGGTHVLAVFDPDKESDTITRLLGAVGYQGNPGESVVAANAAPIDVVKAINAAGGIPILAHVDGPSGAWNLTGNTLRPLFELDELFAMEVVDSASEKPQLYRQRKLAWAEVLGSDSHHPSGQTGPRFPGSHYTWVKMAKPSLEGLRLALLDGGGFSIRRSDDPEHFDPLALPKHRVEAINVLDAQYMGRGEPARLEFSPWLNALVGGRGTGKSTVIHALRLAARRENELENLDRNSEPRLTFDRFSRVPSDRTDEGGLTRSTKIQLIMVRDGVRHRLHWRQDGGGMVIEDDAGDGQWKPAFLQSLTPKRFPIHIFSQGQIAALAGGNQQALLQVIDDAAETSGLKTKFEEARQAFLVLKARVREFEGKLTRRDALVLEQQDVERKLNRFLEAGHSAILTAYGRRRRQRVEVDRQLSVSKQIAGRANALAEDLKPEDLPDGLFDEGSEDDRQAVSVMGVLAAGVQRIAQDLRDAAERLRGTVEAQRDVLNASAWQSAVERAMGDHATLVEMLRGEGITDPNEYSRLIQDRQRLDSELKNLESLKAEQDRLTGQAQEQLRKILGARQAVSAARHEFLSGSLAQNKFVRIRNRTYGADARAIEHSFRQMLGISDERFRDDILVMEDGQPTKGWIAGFLAKLPENSEERCSEIEIRIDDLKQRVHAACLGRGEFGGRFNNYLEREFKRRPELLDSVLTWWPEDGLSVEYSRLGDGTDFRPITQASAGQRSAAMLAFLLAHGKEPLVLDQPEDDLDNHLIYDLVVRQMRENKLRRQILVVTHNPNIVVNGDAEMLHALDFLNGQCLVTERGSLQEERMREEVCRVMEGGREAFERRYRRLGREPAGV